MGKEPLYPHIPKGKREALPRFLQAYEDGWWESRARSQAINRLVRGSIHEKYTPEDELKGIKNVPAKRGWWRRSYYLPEWSVIDLKAQPKEQKGISAYIVEKGKKWEAVGLFMLSRLKYDLVRRGYSESEVDSAVNFLRHEGTLGIQVDRYGRPVYGVIQPVMPIER